MFNFSFFKGRESPRMQATTGFDFGRLLNWRILRGSHEFPGPDGGTCVNEAAIVAAGYPYTPVRRIDDCPASFSARCYSGTSHCMAKSLFYMWCSAPSFSSAQRGTWGITSGQRAFRDRAQTAHDGSPR